jgi:hypothetical protein
MIQTSTTVKIDGIGYTVPYPNVGQQLEIENLKNVLTKGKYAEIASTGSKTGVQLLDLIDAVSYFSVLIPDMKKRLEKLTLADIDPVLQRKLSKAFLKFYTTFILKVEAEINKMLDESETENEPEPAGAAG